MISHVSIGTNDLNKSIAFYSDILSYFDAEIFSQSSRSIFWRFPQGSMLSLTNPFNKSPSDPGNGNMIMLIAKDKAAVDAIYSQSIKLGGVSEGEPGYRYKGRYYGGYFRDLDKNKIAVFASVAL